MRVSQDSPKMRGGMMPRVDQELPPLVPGAGFRRLQIGVENHIKLIYTNLVGFYWLRLLLSSEKYPLCLRFLINYPDHHAEGSEKPAKQLVFNRRDADPTARMPVWCAGRKTFQQGLLDA